MRGFLVLKFYTMQLQQQFRVQKEKVDLAFQLFLAGESVRRTARQVRVAPSTIQRWNDYFYEHSLPLPL